jgi:thiamine biosynthesis lipoprotein
MHTVLLAAHAMGTRFEFVLCGDDPINLRAAGEEALREVQLWHSRLSRFEPDSDIARLNRDPSARIDPELAELLALCDQLREDTGGAFDPRYTPDRSFDLGAIGKGHALDRAAATLQDCGITNALLHGGTSSVIAIGSPGGASSGLPWASAHGKASHSRQAPEGRQSAPPPGWSIQVASNGQPLHLTLHNQALSASSTRHRAHIINPTTNYPARAANTAAIIAPLDTPHAATIAEAWSTALIVLGEAPANFPPHLTSHIHTQAGWKSQSGLSLPLPTSPLPLSA